MSADLITILGELSFAEQISEVSQFTLQGKPGAEGEQTRAALAQRAEEAATEDDAAKRQELVKEVVQALGGQGEGNDREVEGVFNLVNSLIVTQFSDEQATPLLQHVCSVLSSDMGATADKASVRYRVLSNLFNALPETSANRCLVFKALVRAASANDDLEVLSDALAAVPVWLAQWNVSQSDKAELLEQIARDLEAAGHAKRAHDFLLLHLRFLSSASSSSADAKKQAAERTVAAALSLPSVFEFEELSEIEAVKELSAEPIGKLLSVFVSGQFKDWLQWRDANAAEITRLKLSAAQLEHKIRLLELANLCSQSVSSTVPYSQIAKVLDVDIDDIEVWVIDVIRAGLVSGKLSQTDQSLRVYKSVYRTFGTEQWRALEGRLDAWEKSIASIQQTLAEARQQSSAPTTGAQPRDTDSNGNGNNATQKQPTSQQQQPSIAV